MYLNKKQMKALDIALEALDYGLRCDIQQDESAFATDIICEMQEKARKQARKTKSREYWKYRELKEGQQ